jgi:hypothetical protein
MADRPAMTKRSVGLGLKFMRWLGLSLIVYGAVAITVMRFMFPELTETQLFLKFWGMELTCVMGAVIYVRGLRK